MKVNNPIEQYKKSHLKVGNILIAIKPPDGFIPFTHENEFCTIWEVRENSIIVKGGSFTIEKDSLGLNWENFFKIKL